MVSFVSRRRRWWKQLKVLDPTIELSSTIRGDLMLESSGLTKVEQLMVLTSAKNEHDFDAVAVALLEQHAKTHLDDKKSDFKRFGGDSGHTP